MTAPTTAADHNPDPAVVEYARRVVADAPALSGAQLDRIVAVIRAGGGVAA